MKNIMRQLQCLLNVSRIGWAGRLAFVVAVALSAGCEAPLNLDHVIAEKERDLRRYDMLQAAASNGQNVVVVSSVGAFVTSSDHGESWQRQEIIERPALIDVTACDNGDFYALDTQRRVWRQSPDGGWVPSSINTEENTLSIHCAPNGRLWVSASFGTLFWAEGDMNNWTEFSLYEDLQFTAVRFVDQENGFALGEFGTVLATEDGGDSWQRRESIPNEFYPMGVDFLDAQTGWAGGLDGVVWQTQDGGQSWTRQESETSAPIYNVHASELGVFAVGGSAKLVELRSGEWTPFEGAPQVLAFMRAVDTLDNGSLLVAGGGGTLAVISLAGRELATREGKVL